MVRRTAGFTVSGNLKEFRVSSSEFRVRVSSSEFRVLSFEFGVPSFELSSFEFGVSRQTLKQVCTGHHKESPNSELETRNSELEVQLTYASLSA